LKSFKTSSEFFQACKISAVRKFAFDLKLLENQEPATGCAA